MSSTRRQVLKNTLLGAAGFISATLVNGGVSSASAEPTHPAMEALAATQEATPSELAEIAEVARAAARGFGIPEHAVSVAIASATLSLNPRGNRVAQCALILNQNVVFVFAGEQSANGYVRQSGRMLWTDGVTIQALPQESFARSLEMDASAAAAASCCGVPSQIGTCCRWDYQGALECCGPCAFSYPSPPAFIACVAIWCAYCSWAYCSEWWYSC